MKTGDVTAVVMSIGESYVERALASLASQTSPPAEVIRVEGVSPFHHALNQGVASVRTEFLLHVDADMVLDPSCCADLRACVAAGVAVVIGGLRDPLRGSIVGVKLFRTACALAHPFPNALSPDVAAIQSMVAGGWRTAHALKVRPGPSELWHTFGEHQPNYEPEYTFSKFRTLAARARRLGHGPSLRRMIEHLQISDHPAAAIAAIGAACGTFWEVNEDVLRPGIGRAMFAEVEAMLARPQNAVDVVVLERGADARQVFDDYYRWGAELRASGASPGYAPPAPQLGSARWLALIALWRGLFDNRYEPRRARADFAALAALFPDQLA